MSHIGKEKKPPVHSWVSVSKLHHNARTCRWKVLFTAALTVSIIEYTCPPLTPQSGIGCRAFPVWYLTGALRAEAIISADKQNGCVDSSKVCEWFLNDLFHCLFSTWWLFVLAMFLTMLFSFYSQLLLIALLSWNVHCYPAKNGKDCNYIISCYWGGSKNLKHFIFFPLSTRAGPARRPLWLNPRSCSAIQCE